MITLTNVRQDKNIGICSLEDLSDAMPIVLALGTFDGVHQGHRRLLNKAVEIAQLKDASPTIMTFSEHPNLFIPGKTVPELLTTTREKAMLACDCGIKQILLVSFDEEFRELSPSDFIDSYILSLNVCAVVCGYNYRFGKKALGSVEFLTEYLNKHNVDVFVENRLSVDGITVSSTLIRDTVSHGNIRYANELLGYNYIVGSKISHGFKRGTGLGFPTANIVPQKDKCLPQNGVYATYTYVDGKKYSSVTNIGLNPTYNNANKTIETNIFDFEGDLYGKYVVVSFVEKIRNEIKFAGSDDLILQIKKDVDTARNILKDRFM